MCKCSVYDLDQEIYLHFESFSFKEFNSSLRISILMAWSFTISCKTLSSFLRMALSSGPVQVFGTGFSLWPRYTSVNNSSIRTRVQNEHCFLVVAISLIYQMNNTGAAQKMIENQVNWVTLTRLEWKVWTWGLCKCCTLVILCTFSLTPSRILFI